MSKRRICLTVKSYSLPYLDVSPSKKRSVHRRRLFTSLKNCTPVVSPPAESISLSEQTNVEELTNSEEFPCDNDPLCFDFTEKQVPSYSERQQKSPDHWSEIRERLLHAAVETYGSPYSGVNCTVCDNTVTAACYDCWPWAYFCEDHVEEIHSKSINIFHIPQIYKNSY